MTEAELKLWSERMQSTANFIKFFESTPAYISQEFPQLIYTQNAATAYPYEGFPWPRISLYCERCDGFRDFEAPDKGMRVPNRQRPVIDYTCRNCGRWIKTFR